MLLSVKIEFYVRGKRTSLLCVLFRNVLPIKLFVMSHYQTNSIYVHKTLIPLLRRIFLTHQRKVFTPFIIASGIHTFWTNRNKSMVEIQAICFAHFLGSIWTLNPSALLRIMSACSLNLSSGIELEILKFRRIVDKRILSFSIAYLRPRRKKINEVNEYSP